MFRICPACGSLIAKLPPVKDCTSYFLCGINENTSQIDDCNGVALQLHGCTNCGIVFLHCDKLMDCTLVSE